MAYKIAFASSDGIHVDRHFGGASQFVIAEIENGTWTITETRSVDDRSIDKIGVFKLREEIDGDKRVDGCNAGSNGYAGCDPGSCTVGGCGSGSGCGGNIVISKKVELISDCRCIVCQKVGMSVQKQLSKLAIASFDIECKIEDALIKLTKYYDRVDNHKSLRGIAHPDTDE